MAFGNLLALIDDIASVLDDVAVMTKVAAKKTSGVLGDDLALNAEQVSGVSPERELPIVWAVAKGSFLNKLILIPLALILSYFLPFLIVPLLIAGGTFLCFEGAEKVNEKFFHKKEKKKQNSVIKDKNPIDEALKIKGAIRTDFILSAEVIVIALSITANAPFSSQLLTLCVVSILITIGVYGLVALIVKIDDIGLHYLTKQSSFFKKLGNGLILFAPLLMKFLGVAGTIAMFSVGGGIILEELVHLTKFESQNWIYHNAKFLYSIALGLICGNFVIGVKYLIKK